MEEIASHLLQFGKLLHQLLHSSDSRKRDSDFNVVLQGGACNDHAHPEFGVTDAVAYIERRCPFGLAQGFGARLCDNVAADALLTHRPHAWIGFESKRRACVEEFLGDVVHEARATIEVGLPVKRSAMGMVQVQFFASPGDANVG